MLFPVYAVIVLLKPPDNPEAGVLRDVCCSSGMGDVDVVAEDKNGEVVVAEDRNDGALVEPTKGEVGPSNGDVECDSVAPATLTSRPAPPKETEVLCLWSRGSASSRVVVEEDEADDGRTAFVISIASSLARVRIRVCLVAVTLYSPSRKQTQWWKYRVVLGGLMRKRMKRLAARTGLGRVRLWLCLRGGNCRVRPAICQMIRPGILGLGEFELVLDGF